MLSILGIVEEIGSGRATIGSIHDRAAAAVASREAGVRAFARLDLEAARRQAAAAAGPLAGLPVGVKDIIDTADMATGYGSPVYEGHRPPADAAVVWAARRAGGVVLGKTRTTEFANLQPTVTANPRDETRTPGGSSSGSAAAVAAGMVALAFGTQTAGSVIRPAAFCGVAAVKPSYRLLPTVGVKPFSWHLDTVGLFAATVADCAYALAAVTGRDLRVDGRDFGAPRVGVLRGFQRDGADPAMDEALDRLARRAAARGARLVDVRLPALFADALEAQKVIMDVEGAVALGYELDVHGDRLSPVLRDALERGRATPVEAYDAARSTAHAARRRIGEAFAQADVLLLPSAPGVAPRTLASTGDPRFNLLWTLLGVPAVNVPGLVDAGGLPLGAQVVAPFGDDRAALAAADWLARSAAEA